MSSTVALTINYWGTTGSYAAPLKATDVAGKLRDALLHLAQQNLLQELASVATDHARVEQFIKEHLPWQLRATFGGNTTCVTVQAADELFILDCGTGLRELGMHLERLWNAPDFRGRREAHILTTHPHIDHLIGTPFFDPYMDQRNSFTLYGSAAVMKGLEAMLAPSSPMSAVFFPVTFALLKALRKRVTIEAGGKLIIGATTITTMGLRHPGGCIGYRFDCRGRSYVFCTDHEHVEVPDRALADFARGADVLYLDGQYRTQEYEGRAGIMGEAPLPRRGWGHSTVEACAATAAAAGVRQLHLGHREPKRDDRDLASIESNLQQCLVDALRREGRDPGECIGSLAHEGMTVQL
jgi:phosphoribosyl 1,2-cyclic phosphodiesterase